MIEILGGNGLENAFYALQIPAKNTYKDSEYEVWELIEEDFENLCNVAEEEWNDPIHTFLINGKAMLGWYDEYGLFDHIDDEYFYLTDYLLKMFGISTEKNICSVSVGLAKLNNMTLSQLFEMYQK